MLFSTKCHYLIFSILFKNISIGCDILKYIFNFNEATAIEKVKLNQVVAIFFIGPPPNLNEGRKEEILIRPVKI